MTKNCGTCALWHLHGKTDDLCPRLQMPVAADDGCPLHQAELHTCELCGREVVGAPVLDVCGDEVHLICADCVSKGASCPTCGKSSYCAFEHDSICKEPPYVNRVIQQGNMRMQTQVRNPERVKATCFFCPCFDKDAEDPSDGCRRAGNYCSNHIYNYSKKGQ